MSNLNRIQNRILSVERPPFWRALTSLRTLLKFDRRHASRLDELKLDQQRQMTHALLPEIMMKWRL